MATANRVIALKDVWHTSSMAKAGLCLFKLMFHMLLNVHFYVVTSNFLAFF